MREHPSRSAICEKLLAPTAMPFFLIPVLSFNFRRSFSSSPTCLNKLGCCNVIGWLAICFNRLFVILPHQSCRVCLCLCASVSVYDIIIILLSDLYSSVNFFVIIFGFIRVFLILSEEFAAVWLAAGIFWLHLPCTGHKLRRAARRRM